MKTMKQARPPGAKKKLKYEAEPMILLPSVPPESVAQYSINLPSTNKDGMLDEMDMLRNITVHLNEIVHTMEHVYVKSKEAEEEEEEEEEETPPKEDYEDMSTFLMCCSQLRNQLETALREEKLILESLLQWFEKEVHEMEELGEEQLIPDWEVPLADKNVTDNITKLMNRIQRLEELKGRVQELPKLIQISMPKQERKKLPSPLPPSQKDPKNIIEELVMKHGTEDVMNMAQVFQEDTGPQTIETMTNRMLEIVKVFERQTNKLHRVANEQDVLEGKLQKIQQEFRKLAEEKEIMEDELQKMKASDTSAAPDARKKVLTKLEKTKVDEKPQPAEKVQKVPPVTKEQLKMKEDLAKAQANVQALEKEKKMLEEMLQKALEEAEKAKVQLAEVPPNIPDWQFPYTAVGEDDKDLSKRSKKATKSKGKGEDLSQTSATDRTIQRLQRADTGKAGEIFPGKSQDTESQAKPKKKGAVSLDTEKGLSEGASDSASRLTETKKKAKAETAKSKESVETKRRRSVSKGAGKETLGSPVSVLPPLPPIQEKQRLPDSGKDKEEILPVTPREHPEEILPPDSKDEDLSIAEQKPSPLLSESEVQDSLTLPSAEPEEITEESKLRPGRTLESTKKERTRIFTPKKKSSAVERDLPKIHMDSLELQEDELKDAINERMLQLADHLAELKGMPEAETLANLLLTPGKGMEELSDRQKLQLLNQLMMPDELQQAQSLILVEGEVADKMKEEEREKKRALFANVATTLQLLQQTESPEAGQSEEEINEMAEMRRILLANLESNLMELQPAQVLGPSQQDVDREINNLSEKRSQLLANLDLNMKNLQEAQALAAAQPSEMSENKVKELLQQRELLVSNLETNLQDLQSAKALEASLAEKDKNEKEINELSEKRSVLLASLESNLKELQEAQALEAIQPGSVTADKIKELTEQRKLLTADLETNLQALQQAQAYTPDLAEESRLQGMKLHVLSEKKHFLQEKLDSNLKELQEVQMLASLHPDSVTEHKLQELTEQRRRLTAEIDTTVHDMQEIKRHASERLSPIERELYEQSEKKKVLLQNLESNWKELQEAQALEATQPGSVSEHKLQELAEQRKHLTAELEATEQDILVTKRRASERPVTVESAKRELYELSEKKKVLLQNLESNWKELQEAQALEATQPGSVSEHKLQELIEQRRRLNAEVAETVQNIQEIQHRASEGTIFVRPSIRELYALSEKKQHLLEDLESNWKELQEIQALAATHPGSISEHKLQELAERRQHLTANLEATVHNIQKAQDRASKSPVILRPAERELYELSERKQLLLENLEFNRKELQEAQALAAMQPGSISEHKLQELVKQRRRLTMDLEATVEDIQKAQHRDIEKPIIVRPVVRELYELSEKKQLLLGDLESNERELQEAQALAATQPGSISEHRLQVLGEQRRRLTAELEATLNNIQRAQGHVSESSLIIQPADRDLYELSEKKLLLLESLKELQEAQAAAATQPGNISEDRLQELARQRRRLTAELEATVHGIQQAQILPITVTATPSEKELYELSEKKQFLLEMLESNRKELQAAKGLAAVQPGSISESKLQQLAEQRRRLTMDLEATVHKIQEIQHRASEKALIERSERKLHDLSEKKQLLLESVESNLKDIHEAYGIAATQPGSISDKIMQVLNEQTKLLSSSLEVVVQDTEEIKTRISQIGGKTCISQIGGMKRPIERDESQLLQKKKMFLEYLETNLKDLQEAQILFASHPSSINEQKIQELTEQRRLLATALQAVIQDIEDKDQTVKSEERVLEELSLQKKLILKNLASNLKNLKEAQAFAAEHPGGIADDKVKELAEQRKLLTAGLEAVEQDMQKPQGPVSEKVGGVKLGEKVLDEVSERRILALENIELNMKELKDLHVLVATQPDNISEQTMQEIMEKRKLLAANLEAFFQDFQEMESTDLEQLGMTSPDMRKINDLILLSRLESKLNELQHIGVISDSKLDRMKRKIRKLKKQKKGLIDRWEMPLQEDLLTTAKLEEYGLNQKEIKELFGRKKSLFSYVQSSIRDLQNKGIIQQGSIPDKELYDITEDRHALDEYLVAVPVELIESERAAISAKYGKDAEQTAKQKDLAAKLEANIKDLQAVLETERIKIFKSGQGVEIPTSQMSTEPLDQHPLRPVTSGLQLQITRAPEIKRVRPVHISFGARNADESDISSILPRQDRILKKDLELTLKRQLLQQLPSGKTSLPAVPGYVSPEASVHKVPDNVLQQMIDYRKGLLPGQKANMQQAMLFAKYQLNQANILAAAKDRDIFSAEPSAPGTARFHEYTVQHTRPVWEGNQLPHKDYAHKMNLLRKKFMLPEMKGLPGGPSVPSQGPTTQDNEARSIAVCGKGWNVFKSKPELFPVIPKQTLRHN